MSRSLPAPRGPSPSQGHVPVLLAEVLATLAPRDGATYCDGTFGGGGYAGAILGAAACTLYAIDRDPDAIARGAAQAARFPGRLHLLEGRFGEMLDLLAAQGVAALDWRRARSRRLLLPDRRGPRAASLSTATGRLTCAWRRPASPPRTS
ncbi:16S rRNA (cytosine(1402)-N(4))-methyltransferase [Dankookia sp. P2]|uniref:16S rRNA (cytosine(1402)-N(4))-methyltransferase n=1 Tax=Dankookia sp. P2 TaxID=3423955 RepID=UPI003D672409